MYLLRLLRFDSTRKTIFYAAHTEKEIKKNWMAVNSCVIIFFIAFLLVPCSKYFRAYKNNILMIISIYQIHHHVFVLIIIISSIKANKYGINQNISTGMYMNLHNLLYLSNINCQHVVPFLYLNTRYLPKIWKKNSAAKQTASSKRQVHTVDA